MQAKRPPTGVTPASAKSSKDILQENAPRPTGEEQPNRFARRSPKFTVCVIMLVYIASYDVPNEILLLVEFFFRRGKMCKFTHLTPRGPEFLESLGSDLSRKSECFV